MLLASPSLCAVRGLQDGKARAHLAAGLIVLPPHIQHVVLFQGPGDQEVHEGRRAYKGIDATEHKAQQDDDGVVGDLQTAAIFLKMEDMGLGMPAYAGTVL